jgi:hypothetical protein
MIKSVSGTYPGLNYLATLVGIGIGIGILVTGFPNNNYYHVRRDAKWRLTAQKLRLSKTFCIFEYLGITPRAICKKTLMMLAISKHSQVSSKGNGKYLCINNFAYLCK